MEQSHTQSHCAPEKANATPGMAEATCKLDPELNPSAGPKDNAQGVPPANCATPLAGLAEATHPLDRESNPSPSAHCVAQGVPLENGVMPPSFLLEELIEFADSRGAAVDADEQSGIIHGVKILGLESRNGRIYKSQAISAAIALYEGVKVNVNHPKGHPASPRDYQDRLGCLRNVRLTENGLYGDLHFNPHHALAQQLVWDAQHAPENVGLSHNVQARTSRHNEQVLVEEIVKVNSVDLVADPATTSSLFEAEDNGVSQATAKRVLAWLCRAYPELLEELGRGQGISQTESGSQNGEGARLENLLERGSCLKAELRAGEARAAGAHGREAVRITAERDGSRETHTTAERQEADASRSPRVRTTADRESENAADRLTRTQGTGCPAELRTMRPRSRGPEPTFPTRPDPADVARWARMIT